MAKAKFASNVSAKPAPSRMVFAWKPGTRAKGTSAVPAQVVGETLERIEARSGALRPAYVVDEARPEASPLHPLFEWDDSTAAERYRLHQARQVISSVFVSQVDNREIAKPISAFVNLVSQEEGHRYVSTVAAMSDEEKREQILRNAKDDLLRWRHKYDALTEFGELFAVIDRVTETALEAA